MGNFGNVEIMTEITGHETGNGSEDDNSASGGHNSSFDEKPVRKSSISSKNFCK